MKKAAAAILRELRGPDDRINPFTNGIGRMILEKYQNFVFMLTPIKCRFLDMSAETTRNSNTAYPDSRPMMGLTTF